MKKFLNALFFFILPALIMMICYEISLSFLPTSYGIKKNIIENKKDSIQTIIFGTSHAFSGINPQQFDSYTINMANNSQSLYYDIKILEKYIDELPKLKTVIFEICFFSFWYNLDYGPESWRNQYFYKSFDIEPQSALLRIYDKLLIAMYSPNDIAILINNYHTNTSYYSTKGWAINDIKPGNLSLSQAKKRYEQFSKEYMNEVNISENVILMKKILDKLEKKRITIVFVQYPASPVLSNFIEQKVIYRNNYIINNLKNEYPLYYLDYSKDVRFPDSVFVDSDHLGFKAAQLLTDILNKDIKTLTKNQNNQSSN